MYSDGGVNYPMPFTFDTSSGTLDLQFTNGFTNTTTIDSNSTLFVRGQPFSAIALVEKLGRNFINWCENSGDVSADAGTVRIYEKGLVVQANVLQNDLDPNSVDVLTSPQDQPISFETAVGSPSDSYLSTYLFTKPLVITFLQGGVRKYQAFLTQIGEQNT
jgi:hypothetical protein